MFKILDGPETAHPSQPRDGKLISLIVNQPA